MQATQLSVSDLNNPGVSWGAVLAGAAAAAALSFILLILGVGLGLSSVSPWSFNATAIGVSSIAWLAFMQLAASGIGGYMAGRLRVKWSSIHTDEVHFRDTAHGLLAWAVASLITVAVLAGGTRAVLSGAIDAGSGVAAAVSPAAAAGAKAGEGGRGRQQRQCARLLLGHAAARSSRVRCCDWHAYAREPWCHAGRAARGNRQDLCQRPVYGQSGRR
ncbi:hypothetical protein [Janthinobacterium sp. LB2P10]|uniref:hypothetical protein n=1 Tax=Janthinobacterium sp. LB2P10 TaxID=3424194 RepID=UPI003F276734